MYESNHFLNIDLPYRKKSLIVQEDYSLYSVEFYSFIKSYMLYELNQISYDYSIHKNTKQISNKDLGLYLKQIDSIKSSKSEAELKICIKGKAGIFEVFNKVMGNSYIESELLGYYLRLSASFLIITLLVIWIFDSKSIGLTLILGFVIYGFFQYIRDCISSIRELLNELRNNKKR